MYFSSYLELGRVLLAKVDRVALAVDSELNAFGVLLVNDLAGQIILDNGDAGACHVKSYLVHGPA
jgi:hypothetical protein